MARLVEGYCGMCAVTLSYFGFRPPASRIGSKLGYAHEIVPHLGNVEEFICIDTDPALVRALQAMFSGCDISEYMGGDAREQWYKAKAARTASAAAWWVWTAGARGGIGGFKGAHKHRPNVDGFIPNRESLQARLDAIANANLPIRVECASAATFRYREGDKVYFDPPYLNAQGYGATQVVTEKAWGQAIQVADVVCVSERDKTSLPWLPEHSWHDLTRKGQARRSMTRTTREVLSVCKRTP